MTIRLNFENFDLLPNIAFMFSLFSQ